MHFSHNPMDLKQLEYFVQVAEMGSFTRASAFLSIAQPALSRQVRALEVELRQTLFERNGRGVTLTPAGRHLLEHSRGILAQVARARQDLERDRNAVAGRIVVALPPSVSRTMTVTLVRAFRARLPQATLSLVEGLSQYSMESLAVGRVDCAVVYNVTPAATVELTPVLDEPLFLVSREGGNAQSAALDGTPLPLRELGDYPLVVPNRPHSLRMLLETALAQQGRKTNVALEIDSIPAILDLVLEENLHAVLAMNAIRSTGQPERYHARPIVQPDLLTTMWIATSAQRPSGPLLDQTCALIRELLRAKLG